MDTDQNLNNQVENNSKQFNTTNYPNISNNNIMNYNPFQNMLTNPFNNPFLIQNITDSILINMSNRGLITTIDNNINQEQQKLINKSNNGKTRERFYLNEKDDIDPDIKIPGELTKEKMPGYGNLNKKDSYKESELREINNNFSKEISQEEKEGIYIYTDSENNKYFYSFQKVSSDGNYFELRCKDRNNCKGRAKYDIQTGDINITQKCTIIKYEDHNYIKEEKIKEKIRNQELNSIEMEDALYQKLYFQEIYSTYPTMTYNQIVLNIVEKFNIKKIKYSLNSFNVFKSNLNKKKFNNKNIDEKLKEIKLYGKAICICKLEYIDNKKDNKKGFYLFGTDYSLSLLNSPEINQYFSDCTYKFIPFELKGKYSLLVILGYNFKRDKYQLILIALLTNEDTEIYSNLYNFLLNTYNFKPKYITFDFARGNINAI